MVGATSAERATQRYGTIVVVGGGCYGSYYVRQLGRAARAGALTWQELVVVDRDAGCAVATSDVLPQVGLPARLEVAEWGAFFGDWLARRAADPASAAGDAIVPSPLMPHLMFEWVLARAHERWPDRSVAVRPLERPPATPWERATPDGTHYASFATWTCPINCIEPARCPHTRGPRDWSMPVAIRGIQRAVVFHCTHRAYGVGMVDVAPVLEADRLVQGCGGELDLLVGTASHCHGAVNRLVVGDADSPDH